MRLQRLNAGNFESHVLGQARPVLVMFGAEFCPACRLMEGTLEEFSALHREIAVRQVDVTSTEALAIRERYLWPLGASFSVSLIPTTVLFAGGRPQQTLYGAVPVGHLEDELAAWVTTPAGVREPEALVNDPPPEDVPARRLRPGTLGDA